MAVCVCVSNFHGLFTLNCANNFYARQHFDARQHFADIIFCFIIKRLAGRSREYFNYMSFQQFVPSKMIGVQSNWTKLKIPMLCIVAVCNISKAVLMRTTLFFINFTNNFVMHFCFVAELCLWQIHSVGVTVAGVWDRRVFL